MAKPKLALVPSTIGTKVYSVLPSDGDGDFTFTRATKATRINSLGLIEEVLETRNRLNYSLLDGKVQECPHLLLEPVATNLEKYSEFFDYSHWTKLNINVTTSFIAPDGTLGADKLTENTTTGTHAFYATGFAISNSQSYTASIFVKYDGRQWVHLWFQYGSTSKRAFFDVKNGVKGSVESGVTSKIENYGNGWYRISATATSDGTTGRFRFYLAEHDGDTNGYAGDGSSGVYVWGAMAEKNSFATSYIPTTTGQVTRNAETAVGSGRASTFNDSEGILMTEISALADDGTNRQSALSDNSSSDRVMINLHATSNQIQGYITNNVGEQADMRTTVVDTTLSNKIVVKYKLNDCALWVNGFELATDTSATMLSGLQVFDYDNYGGSLPFYARVKQLQYFDSVLSDAQLEELTSWVSFREMANGQGYIIE